MKIIAIITATQSDKIYYSRLGGEHKKGRCWWVEGTPMTPTGGMGSKSRGVFFELALHTKLKFGDDIQLL